jgi:NADPH-dependent 2,4-dienoyl-CoA reductase/sulfur reductase-like enzyme
MRLLIIGGSDAGISAGLRAQELRPETEITIVLRDAFPNFSICGLPFYISGETPDWKQLAHRTDFAGIEILTDSTAESVDTTARIVHVRTSDGRTRLLRYDKLIIATGAKPLLPMIPGIEHAHPLHTMSDSFKVHDRVARGKVRRAAVVGAGYIGVEMADALTRRGIEVQLIGRSGSVLPTVDSEVGEIIRKQLESRSVGVHTGVEILSIERERDGLRIAGSSQFATTSDLVIWSAGVEPASDLARAAGVSSGIRHACQVTRRMETNVHDVYAAGDCVETWHRILDRNVWLPLGTTAHKQGSRSGATSSFRERWALRL